MVDIPDNEEPSWDEFAKSLQESSDPAKQAAYDVYMAFNTHHYMYQAFRDVPDWVLIEFMESLIQTLRKKIK